MKRIGLRMIVLAACGAAAWSCAAQRVTKLEQLRNQKRVLLIFAPSFDDARMVTQLSAIRDRTAEAADRDLLAIAVPETGDPGTEFKLADAAVVRKQFGVDAGKFWVILVGKDGSEKLHSNRPIPFDRLREAIDAMPMRQDEMRDKKRP